MALIRLVAGRNRGVDGGELGTRHLTDLRPAIYDHGKDHSVADPDDHVCQIFADLLSNHKFLRI